MFGLGLGTIGDGTSNGAPPGYLTTSSDYDGTNDYATRGAVPTGLVDGKAGIASTWARIDGGDGAARIIFSNNATPTTQGIYFALAASNVIQIFGCNSANVAILNAFSTETYLAGTPWRHFLASWDLAASVVQIAVNGVLLSPTILALSNDTLDYAKTNFAVGAETDGGGKWNGCLSESFFHTVHLDLSVEANIRKFISTAGKPVFLGANGEVPLGVQPLIYCPNGNPSVNRGSGGNFTITGALDVGSTSPSD